MTTHPNDIELLELIEGELPEPEAVAVRAHVQACAACSAAVAELEAGRTALRATPLLELSDARLARMLERLPAQERAPSPLRAVLARPRRLALVLTPAAVAAVAVAVTLSVTGGEERRDSAAAPADATAEAAAPEEPAQAVQSAPADAAGGGADAQGEQALRSSVRAVAGPAGEVAALLRERGLDARVVAGAVEVRGADPAEVEKLLEGRAAGDVEVVVVPAG